MSGKTGTTETHRSSAFLGFTNNLAAAVYIFGDSPTPGEICSSPLRPCVQRQPVRRYRTGENLVRGNEPGRQQLRAHHTAAGRPEVRHGDRRTARFPTLPA